MPFDDKYTASIIMFVVFNIFSSTSELIAHLQFIHNVSIESKLLLFDNIDGKLIYYSMLVQYVYAQVILIRGSGSVNTIIAGKYCSCLPGNFVIYFWKPTMKA